MDPVKPCNPYYGVIRQHELFRGADGKTVFKVYYVDIVGRANPALTEWDKAAVGVARWRELLAATTGVEGVGFITAFPHITKAFRFGPEGENAANVRAWKTPDMQPLDLHRSGEYLEFACLAEAVLAADEFRFWAAAHTVAEYLDQWSDYVGGPVLNHRKLAAYWG